MKEARFKAKSLAGPGSLLRGDTGSPLHSLARLQLEEKNTSPTCFKEDKIPSCIANRRIVKPRTHGHQIAVLCNLHQVCHRAAQCPWRRRLPTGVTQVGGGYGVDGYSTLDQSVPANHGSVISPSTYNQYSMLDPLLKMQQWPQNLLGQ
ncbi:hypothetical protein FF1_038709 [Malus domestica]